MITQTHRTCKTVLAVGGLIASSLAFSNETNPNLPPCRISPLVVDVSADGFNLGDAGIGVYFDVNADGRLDHVQWVRPGEDEAFLVADFNFNGIVDDGSELFGQGTTIVADGSVAPNGFVALAQYDGPSLGGNDDGLITSADAIWSSLHLWRDINADGISTLEEMSTPEEAGLSSFETIPRRSRYADHAGNLFTFWAWSTRTSPPRRTPMVDVFFLVLPDSRGACLSRPDTEATES